MSPAADGRRRVKFLKLAWDALGSEFAARHTRYGMFRSGPTVVMAGMG